MKNIQKTSNGQANSQAVDLNNSKIHQNDAFLSAALAGQSLPGARLSMVAKTKALPTDDAQGDAGHHNSARHQGSRHQAAENATALYVVDAQVKNIGTLLKNLPSNALVLQLSADRDGLTQINEFIQSKRPAGQKLDAVHMVSHGSEASITLGNTVLNAANLAQHRDALKALGQSMTSKGDILLYGCDVASGEAGLKFMADLAKATGADVAASTDKTGSSDSSNGLSGDWVLEQHVGRVQTKSLDLSAIDVGLLGSGTDGNDTLTATPEDNVLVGGLGSDTYIFNSATGIGGYYNYVGETDEAVSNDTLQLNYSSALLKDIRREGGTHLVVDSGTAGRVQVSSSFDSDKKDIETIRFTDRTLNVLNGTQGSDNLVGTAGDDLVLSSLGNDVLDGGQGNDIYVFSNDQINDGTDKITDAGGSDLLFVNVARNQINSAKLAGSDLVINYSGEITLTGATIEKIVLSDQIILDIKTGTANADNLAVAAAGFLVSGAGNDTLTGGSGGDLLFAGENDDSLTGGLGEDVLKGEAGSDTYTFKTGDGTDLVYDLESTGSVDVVKFSDVASTALRGFSRDGNALVIQYGVSDQVTLQNFYTNGAIEKIQFTDVTLGLREIYTKSGQPYLTTITGTTGADAILQGVAGDNNVINALDGNDSLVGANQKDTLNGDGGNDTLVGGTGNDLLVGGTGADTYRFSVGDGADVITDVDSNTSNKDVIVFANVASTAITSMEFVVNGKSKSDSTMGHLLMRYGNGDTLVVRDYFSNSGYFTKSAQIEEIKFSDGVTLTPTDVYSKLGMTYGDDYVGVTNTGGAARNVMLGSAGTAVMDGGAGADVLINYGGGQKTFVVDHKSDYIFGRNVAGSSVIVKVDDYNLNNYLNDDTSVTVSYGVGVRALPAFIQAMIGSVSFPVPTRLGQSMTVTYAITDAFTAAQKAAVANVLNEFSNTTGLKFIEASVAGEVNPSITIGMLELAGLEGTMGVYNPESYGGTDYSAGMSTVINISHLSPDSDFSKGSSKYFAMMHELGHVLGLHSNNVHLDNDTENGNFYRDATGAIKLFDHTGASIQNTVMMAAIDPTRPVTYTNELQEYDLASLHYLYGVNQAARSGNQTYTFADHYIWDGSGVDTFSAAERIDGVNINLREGSWIYAGSKASDAIASSLLADGQGFIGFGTTIEHAIGGSGNDTLTGNAAANNLSGGAGADSLSSGVGQDTLVGGLGADTLAGGLNSDTYSYAKGDGNDTIMDSDLGSVDNNDVLSLATNITSSDLTPTRSGTNLVLKVISSGETITINNYFGAATGITGGAGLIENIKFLADNTVWDLNKVNALLSAPPVVNNAPTVDKGVTAQAATQNAAFSYVIPADAFKDIDVGDVLTYSVTRADGTALPTWLTFNATTRTLSGTPTNADVGSLSIAVKATDKAAAAVTSTFALNIANVNDAPTIDKGVTAQAATQNAAFSYVIPADAFKDIDVGDVLTYSVTRADGTALPTWLTFNATTRTLSGTPTNADVGSLSIAVKATDKAAAAASSTFTLNIANVNDAPTVDKGVTAQAATQNAAFSYVIPTDAFKDIDVGDVLTYSVTRADGTALPTWLTFNATTRTLSGTPTNADVGSLSIAVKATDKAAAAASSTFTLNIANVNDAPTVDKGVTAQAATQNAAFSYVIPADAFKDVDVGDVLTYSVTRADGTALPTWLTFNATTRTLSGTPANGDVGSLSIAVKATDKAAAAVTSTFALNIANVNDAPTVDKGVTAQAATQNAAFSYVIPADTFKDIDVGDVLTYSVTRADGAALPAWLTFNAATRTLSGTPANGDVGSLSIAVKATDKAAAAVTSTFTLNVANVNDAPTVDKGLTTQNAAKGNLFSYVIPADAFKDIDVGDVLTYSVTRADGTALPTWLTFNATTRTLSGTPANGDVGSLSIAVKAADKAAASVTSTFGLNVLNSNTAPTVNKALTTQSATQKAAFSYVIPADTFKDIDVGDVLTYSVTRADGTALPTWLTFNATTRTLSGTPANGDVGSLSIAVKATDKAAAAVSSTFTLNIANVNDAPTVDKGVTAQAATQNAAFSYVIPADAFKDIDVGDVLTYSVTRADGTALPTWLTFNAATRTLSGTPANGDVGSLSIAVKATDKAAAAVNSTFTLNIANVNDAPTVDKGVTAQAATQNAAFSYVIPADAFKDIDVGDVLTYSVTRADGTALPTWLTFNAATRTLSGTPANGDVGSLSIAVKATDKAAAAVTSTFTLNVANVNDAPTVDKGLTAQAATQNTAFSYVIPADAFKDIDIGDVLTYSVTRADGTALPTWLTFNAATRTLSGTPANGDVGSLSIAVKATDKSSASITSTLSLSVAAASNLITGTVNNDVLGIAGVLNQEIRALSGNDTITGYKGNDTLIGDTGGDSYLFSLGDGVDLIQDLDSDIDNVDSVFINVNSTSIVGMTQVGSDLVIQYSASDKVTIQNYFTGTANRIEQIRFADNVILGTSADEYQMWGTGGDFVMKGMGGNDEFVVDSLGDRIVAGAGNDMVYLWGNTITTYTLESNVEDVNMSYSSVAVSAFGNELNNWLIGNDLNNVLKTYANWDQINGGAGNDDIDGGTGDDSLYGESGNDTIYGGDGLDEISGNEGADQFVFNTTLNAATNKDTILDFTVAEDVFVLDRQIFKSLTTAGALSAGNLRVGSDVTTGADANDYIIYNQADGNMYYDADGSGSGASICFAYMDSNLAMTSAQFKVI